MSRQAQVCLVALVILAAQGCSEAGPSGREEGAGGSGGFAENGGSGGAQAGGSGGAGMEDGGSGGTVAEGGSGGAGGTGVVGPTDCAPVESASICGNEASIVRVLARLPENAAPIRGRLKLNLRHLRLGEGSSGGYPHVPLGGKAPRFDVDLRPGGAATAWLDMCEGGEMWSEENCEFNLFAWVDANNNELVDQGEPAGREIVSLSCHDDGSQCYTIDLSCTEGARCVAFDEPAVCRCARGGCDSPIAICTP